MLSILRDMQGDCGRLPQSNPQKTARWIMKAEYFTEEGGEMRAAMAANRDGRNHNRTKGPDEDCAAWREHRIRPDMRLLVQDARSGDKPLDFEYDSEAPPLQFFYCLEGEAQIHIRRKGGGKVGGRLRPRQYLVAWVPGARATAVREHDGPMKVVAFLVNPEALRQLACAETRPCDKRCGASCREHIRDLAAGMLRKSFHQQANLPLHLEITLQQIADCPKIGEGLGNIFLEYKAMELFYNQISLFDAPEESERKKLSAFELKAAQEAYDRLMRDLASPPYLMQLAKDVGLTHTRLNRIFKILHNDTVFGVFRSKRLECAKQMLESGRQSVSEIAFRCGFATPSHLSRCFLVKYGIQPKRYQSALAAPH